MFLFVAGFTDGSVVLTKGDITRDRHSKTLTLHEESSPVTGLAFRQVAKVTHLFVATLEKVHVSLLSLKVQALRSTLSTLFALSLSVYTAIFSDFTSV